MKVKLKYQLCGLVSITALAAVGILTLITWFYIYNLVFDLRSSRLEVIASLKARELAQSLLVFTVTARALSQRITIARALAIPVGHPEYITNWTNAEKTFGTLMTTYDNVLYVAVQNTTLNHRYMNVTTLKGVELLDGTELGTLVDIVDDDNTTAAYRSPDGAPEEFKSIVPGERKGTPIIRAKDVTDDGLFLGPIYINKTYVASLTVPIYNNTTVNSSTEKQSLGYMTIVFNIDDLLEVVDNTEGLGKGRVMVVGPANRFNRWNNSTGEFAIDRKTAEFKYVLPPKDTPELALTTVKGTDWPAVLDAWDHDAYGKGVKMEARDPEGVKVAIGYSPVIFYPTASSFLVLAVQNRAEAFDSMDRLRKIVLGSVFGMFGLIIFLTYPLAYFSVRPIHRLYEATKLCGRPPEYREESKKSKWWPFGGAGASTHSKKPRSLFPDMEQDPGYGDDHTRSVISSQNSSGRREIFRIPQKVMVGKHWITDELTGLSQTFNDMTDELLAQYENLESKVQQRTEELEQQKVLAEQANEAKTMFIANVSHELRTPLNGILGMCSLVLEEGSLPPRTRDNLEVVFKSGELLLHLLNDLLTFSRNQVWGASVKLETAPFRISDLTAQIIALFGTQAADKKIDLSYEVVPPEGIEWGFMGDINRILQVVINLINNSLKFTPEHGSVQLMVVIEANPDSSNVTPYTDMSAEKPEYITSAEFAEGLNRSPSSTHTGRRPPLFTRRSASTGIPNPDSIVNKAIPHRFRNFLSPSSSIHSRSNQTSPIDEPSSWYVEFRVIDTGPGIAEHMRDKIFQPFVQGDAGLSRKYGGTGLGLAICQQLARLMGGDIQLKTFEGAGSTFTLRIPLHSAPMPQSTIASTTTNPGLDQHSRRSHHTTAKSISMLSSVRESVPENGNIRLVGLSQPFFVPSNPGSEVEVQVHDAPDGTTKPPLQPPPPPPNHDSPPQPQSEKTPAATTSPLPAPATPPPPPKPRLRVLIAEDNKVNQKVLVKLLNLEGVETSDITVAEDGQQAIDRVTELLEKDPEAKYDVVFMDIQMPNVDGHQATVKIREMGYKAPIIALTAFADESNVKKCFESGMDCFLAKPVKKAQIMQMLKLYCAGFYEGR